MFQFSQRSLDNLKGVHPDLVKVAMKALSISAVDFAVVDGLRTSEEHEANLKAGKSWTKRSRHQDGLAIDVAAYVDGKISWDPKHYTPIIQAFKVAAKQLDVPIEFGADWKVRDLGHIELDRRKYP